MELTRRRFATLLGLVTVGGIARVATAGDLKGTLKDALSRRHGVDVSSESTPQVATATAPAADHHDVLMTPEDIWQDLMEGNKRFIAGAPRAREFVHAREELAKGQHPKVIVLGCADSRLSPELIFDKGLGDLFVVRTAGNIADEVALGSLEYAVEHLHASVLVVLGHEKCGAVAAAASGGKMPTPNLEEIVDKISPAIRRLKREGTPADQLAARGVEANVHLSAKDLLRHSPILRKEVGEKKLTVMKAVYRLGTGEVARLA